MASLQTQTTLDMISESLARSIRDFDVFIEDHVAMEWDAQRRRIYDHFGIKPRETPRVVESGLVASESAFKGTFGRSRRDKTGSLRNAGSRGPGASSMGRSSLHRSAIGAAGPIGQSQKTVFADVAKSSDQNGYGPGSVDKSQREKQARYIEKVQNLNATRLQHRHYPLLHELEEVVRMSSEGHGVHIENCYKALIEIVGEEDNTDVIRTPADKSERRFIKAYLDDSASSPDQIKLNKRILHGSATHLERSFYQEMETIVSKNPSKGRLGGSPDRLSVVKAYIRIRDSQKDLRPDDIDLQQLGDEYVWAVIFYLLRSGCVAEAVRYVVDNSASFNSIDRHFVSYITSYHSSPERLLPRELQQRITNEYTQRLRIAPENSIDPFKMACYKIIGRCDLQKRSIDKLNQEPNDFMWLQLRLAREVSQIDARANTLYGLAEVQDTVKDICSSYINEPSGPMWHMCFYFYLLAGKFEHVVDMLYKQYPVEATHFAIALCFYGLIRVPDPFASENLLSYTTREQPQINFGLMIGYYTRDFRAANVGAAVDYLCLIGLNKDLPGDGGKAQEDLCHDALRELVLESREFALIVGDMRADGTRIRGLLEERLPLIGVAKERDFVRNITLQAASIADDNGRTTDAVLLNHLAEEYDAVMTILGRTLSESLSVPLGQDPMRLQPLKPRSLTETDARQSQDRLDGMSLTSIDDPEELARNMMRVYDAKAMYKNKIDKQLWVACTTLLGMCQARSLVQREQWPEALDVSLAPRFMYIYIHSLLTHHRRSRLFTCSPSTPTRPQPPSVRPPRDLLHCPIPLRPIFRIFSSGPSPRARGTRMSYSARNSVATRARVARWCTICAKRSRISGRL